MFATEENGTRRRSKERERDQFINARCRVIQPPGYHRHPPRNTTILRLGIETFSRILPALIPLLRGETIARRHAFRAGRRVLFSAPRVSTDLTGHGCSRSRWNAPGKKARAIDSGSIENCLRDGWIFTSVVFVPFQTYGRFFPLFPLLKIFQPSLLNVCYSLPMRMCSLFSSLLFFWFMAMVPGLSLPLRPMRHGKKRTFLLLYRETRYSNEWKNNSLQRKYVTFITSLLIVVPLERCRWISNEESTMGSTNIVNKQWTRKVLAHFYENKRHISKICFHKWFATCKSNARSGNFQ